MSNYSSSPLSAQKSSSMMGEITRLLNVEQEIRVFLASGKLEEAKSLFANQDWSFLLGGPGKLWLVALDAPLSKEVQDWLTTLIPFEKSLKSWSLAGDVFVRLAEKNPDLFEKLAYTSDCPYSDYLYKTLLQTPHFQKAFKEELWLHLRQESRQWGNVDYTSFLRALSSDNAPAAQWLLKVEGDWEVFSEALNEAMGTSPDRIIKTLKALSPMEIQWDKISTQLEPDCYQKIKATFEQEDLSLSLPQSSTSSPKPRI